MNFEQPLIAKKNKENEQAKSSLKNREENKTETEEGGAFKASKTLEHMVKAEKEAEESVEKARETIEDILKLIPDSKKLSELFPFRMQQYAEGKGSEFLWMAIKESKLMSLQAALTLLLGEINTRRAATRGKILDAFDLLTMLPTEAQIEGLNQYLTSDTNRAIVEKMQSLKNIVIQTNRELL